MYKVIVLGGGPSGLSAALLLADLGYQTLVLEDGRTQMGRAYVTNYLGLDEFEGPQLLEKGRQQVEQRGVEIRSERVTAIDEQEDHLLVTTAAGQHRAESILLCCGQGPGMELAKLANVELVEHDEPFTKLKVAIDERGRTSRKNVYAAGICAGTSSQAIIAAGHGAQVALNLISEQAGERVHIHRTIPPKK
ncbi:FAD-dependent oxidoreductase [Tumebacillus lipolyticus]|uniref:FAD-dependent oxidoreductase n=1 Tax=Tumebacillus lipolyticus TaxID=1280370 RepID=A0ABW4ZWS3_9BACL